ncbi:Photosystem I assembly protein Ycf3 [subsurface metagenome]
MPSQSTVRVSLGDAANIEIKLRPFKGPPPVTKKISTKAVSLLNEGKYKEAIEKFTEAITEDPEIPIFYYYRGAAFEKTGDLDKAMEDYQKSVELKPDFILPTANIGKIYAKKREFEKAIEFYKKSSRIRRSRCHQLLQLRSMSNESWKKRASERGFRKIGLS